MPCHHTNVKNKNGALKIALKKWIPSENKGFYNWKCILGWGVQQKDFWRNSLISNEIMGII